MHAEQDESIIARKETAISELQQRIDMATAQVDVITQSLNRVANGAFGEEPEQSGDRNIAMSPVRSGGVGNIFDALDILSKRIELCRHQADRFSGLA